MALINTIEEVQKHINVDINMGMHLLLPSIEDAELTYIKPLLGNDLYNELHTAYNSATTLEGELAKILPYVQRALANYAAYMGIEEWSVSIGSVGIQQQVHANSQPAPMGKVANLRLKYITTADRAADHLLEFLETASQSNTTSEGEGEEGTSDRLYASWYNSSANPLNEGRLLYKTSIANKYIDINNSRRLFLRLKKYIATVEDSIIKSLICGPQYVALINAIKEGTLLGSQKILVEKIQSIIAKRALYLCLPMLPVIVSAEGIFMLSANDGAIQKLQAGALEKDKMCASLLASCEEDERTLRQYLKDNIDQYPLIKQSTCWHGADTVVTDAYRYENKATNKHFGV